MIDLFTRFNKSKLNIETLSVFDRSEKFHSPGALLYVENGKGLIYTIQSYSKEEKKSLMTLMFGDKPLFQLQDEEYFCPTCEKIVKTGYNLEQSKEFSFDAINSDTASFEEVLEQIKPLVGLLMDGYYCIWDTELYPTDGGGNLFWDYPNDDTVKPGSCLVYLKDGEWGSLKPHFTIATEPFEKCNKERVEYYRQHPGARAIAYFMDGNLTALLDGHHKAMAAALDHRPFNAVVISQCFANDFTDKSGKQNRFIMADDVRIDAPKKWVNKERLQKIKDKIQAKSKVPAIVEPLKAHSGMSVEDTYPAKELVKYYPTAEQQACIDTFDVINDELIDEYMNKAQMSDAARFGDTLKARLVHDSRSTGNLVTALEIMRSERFLEFADYILRFHYDSDLLIDTIDALVDWNERGKQLGYDTAKEIWEKLGKENLQDYLISYMAEIEGEKPVVGKHVFEVL